MKKILLLIHMVILMTLSICSFGICDNVNDSTMLGILHSDMEYPPPAGESMAVYPEPGNPGFSLSVASPVKTDDTYPDDPESVAFVTIASGMSYWIEVPKEIQGWRNTGSKAIRFSLPGDVAGNDLTIYQVDVIEIIGEAITGTILTLNTEEMAVSVYQEDAGSNKEIMLKINENTNFINNPTKGDECQIIFDENNIALTVVKGQG